MVVCLFLLLAHARADAMCLEVRMDEEARDVEVAIVWDGSVWRFVLGTMRERGKGLKGCVEEEGARARERRATRSLSLDAVIPHKTTQKNEPDRHTLEAYAQTHLVHTTLRRQNRQRRRARRTEEGEASLSRATGVLCARPPVPPPCRSRSTSMGGPSSS